MGEEILPNLRFADDIVGLAGDEQELKRFVEGLDKASEAFGMEINADKTKLMTNDSKGITSIVKVKDQALSTVTSFKYLGAVISDEGSKPEVLSKIAQATAALTKLKPIWERQPYHHKL